MYVMERLLSVAVRKGGGGRSWEELTCENVSGRREVAGESVAHGNSGRRVHDKKYRYVDANAGQIRR